MTVYIRGINVSFIVVYIYFITEVVDYLPSLLKGTELEFLKSILLFSN